MNEIMDTRNGDLLTAQQATAVEIKRMAEMMATMAAMLQATTESMEQLRRQVRLLEKVTPAQASAINRAIRERAAELCAIYMLPGDGCEKPVAAAIRKAIKLRFGANSAKDLPRCEYEVAMSQVQGWDDYKTMKKIKGRAKA